MWFSGMAVRSQDAIDFAALVANTPNCVAVFDENDLLIYANSPFRGAFFVQKAERISWRAMMRRNYELRQGPVIATRDLDAWLNSAVTRRGTTPYRAFEAELHGGNWMWITETTYPDGKMLLVASDISTLKPNTRSLRQQRDDAIRESFTDELTDIPNRRYVMRQLSDWLNAQKHSSPRDDACVALLDLDHFKPINDEHGHAIGDRILVHFTEQVVSNIRLIDLFGRVGGEEFLLFMPHCCVEDARNRLNLLADIVRASHPVKEIPGLGYTFSGGLAAVAEYASVDELLRSVDDLLYMAKRTGRDRFCG